MKHTKAGGAMHKNMNKPAESKTARPAKAKVMSKPGETRKRMVEGPGMKKWSGGKKA